MSDNDSMPICRALISVSNKTGIVELAWRLMQADVEILSTGGTAALLRDHGVRVVEVSDYTGFPEMMNGRIKTLHPKIHAGLLGRRGTDDDEMEIIMGLGDDTISDKAWEDIEAGAPSEAAIMKEVGKYRSGSWALFRVKFTIPPRTKHFLLFIQISVQQTQLFLIKPIFRCDFQSLSIAHVPASMYDI